MIKSAKFRARRRRARWLKGHNKRIKSQFTKLKADSCSSKSSLKAMDRQQRQELYCKGGRYLRQDICKGVNVKVMVAKCFNPPDQPYAHLTKFN